ncbi:uncharacterized protein KY384_006227 [Bacidia gigantensis]|uniref:uncharacterized protein n=1 Tax=Bacidia gigantensis TaxID=2732470 RepID=UPI001D0495A3|nr:uncharacterized protein KY384_006227 [Bacidia gigantensis]KAG8529590.1 hypothetical protein KY384_006227 [Bacidia gigantensis]
MASPEETQSMTDDDHPDFDNNSQWPRRLLHVPTMTSHKWSPGNKYGSATSPPYIAISYTWGRYMLSPNEMPEVKPLPIRGVSWPIPRVNPSTHFTVSEFQHILKQMTLEPHRWYAFTEWRWKQRTWRRRVVNAVYRFLEQHARVYEFVWLDVACIDQRWTRSTMLEIGRQARIFSHAKHSYVWLSRLTEANLRPLLLDLRGALYGLQNEPWVREKAVGFQSRPWLRMAVGCLSGLLSDPWFSSLWTLQEAFLCTQAVILSRDGKAVLDVAQFDLKPWTLQRLFGFVNDFVLWAERSTAPRAEPEYSELMDLVQQSGMAALWLNTPMGLLGVSYTRKTTRSLDRVYGVMQTLGSDFQVGLARADADPSKEYTLSELEDEFGATVIERYPILSQMHVYLEPPEPGKGWCVRGSSAVPMIAERGDLFGWSSGNRLDIGMEVGYKTLCDISTVKVQDNLWARLSGRACSFIKLQQAWKEADQSSFATRLLHSNWRMHRSSTPSIHMIALDRGTPFEPEMPELRILNVVGLGSDDHQHNLAAWMTEQPNAEDVRVFLLGWSHMQDEVFHTGLILIKRESTDITYWHRIGICMWMTSHLSDLGKGDGEYCDRAFLTGEDDDWHSLEGLFG